MENPSQIDLRQSAEYADYMSQNGWGVQGIKTNQPTKAVNVFIRHIGPLALAKLQRPAILPDVNELKSLIVQKRIFMFKFEPVAEIGTSKTEEFCKIMSLKRDNSPLLATKTSVVDLTKSKDELMASFKKDCRYTLRKLQAQNYKSKWGDFDLFYQIWKMSAKRKHLWIPGKTEYERLIKAFGDKALVVTIGHDAGACVLIAGQTAFYYYAGSTAEGVKQNLPYLVVWQAMLEAKSRGCSRWDFEGIYDTRWPTKSWKGFTHFKNSFSGQPKEFPGAYNLWRLPF